MAIKGDFKLNSPRQNKMREALDRIIDVSDPQKIIIFGSSARDEQGENSDFDLLVIKEGNYKKGELVEDIYMNLVGVGHPVDIVLVTPEELDLYRDSNSSVIKPALEEGKLVYEREAKSAK